MINSSKHHLWCEKYRPTTLDDYVFHNEAHKKAFTQMIRNKTIPHLLLSGVQGSGKTTIAEILINEIGFDSTDVIIINASDENSVDDMREKIKDFIGTFAMGEFKVVLLEEADYLSKSAQAILRKYMEDDGNTARFILTCNYIHKILPAVKSRTQHYNFKSTDKNEIAEFAAKILIEENIEFDIDTLDKYVSVGYPDIRKIVNLIQQNCISGHLLNQATAEDGDYRFALLDLIAADNWVEARAVACANVLGEEWEDVYRFLYENLEKSTKFAKKENYEPGYIIIAKYLYRQNFVSDAEINAAAMFIELSQV